MERVGIEAFVCTPGMSSQVARPDFAHRVKGWAAASARRHDGMWRAACNALLVQPGYSYVASGSEQLVVTDGQEVLKIHRASRDMSLKGRQELQAQLLESYSAAREWLSPFVLSQSVTIERPPLRQGCEAVVTRQPLIAPAVENLLVDNGVVPPEIIPKPIRSTSGRALSALCKAHTTMLDETSLGADVGGRGNIVIGSDGNILLLDAYPTTLAHRERPSLVAGCATIGEEHQLVAGRLMQLATELENSSVHVQ